LSNDIEILHQYLTRMSEIRSGSPTNEVSYYGPLETYFNQIGETLTPRVLCNGQIKNQGAGHPDFGLYSTDQIDGSNPQDALLNAPARGVIEVKGPNEPTIETANSEQVERYLNHYGLVLVTNFRTFRLLARDGEETIEIDEYSLADTADNFWDICRNPRHAADEHGAAFSEFLRIALMRQAPLRRPAEIAWLLASYAKRSLSIVRQSDPVNLATLRETLEGALRISFEGEEGDAFFTSTFVQTLFYGVFSAWIVQKRESLERDFDWRTAGYSLRNPLISALFDTIAAPTNVRLLSLSPILDRTQQALNRIDASAFFEEFDSGVAIQHFYEPFLEKFDPVLRAKFGVWYTPPEIVTYMVERVDQKLREELGIARGLADENVYVLDPACGTGAYVLEVLKRIHRTVQEEEGDDFVGEDVREAALSRVFGFEILSAPYVIAHWRITDYLESINAPLDTMDENGFPRRAAVYLTNALTGWVEDPDDVNIPMFPALEDERDKADEVKRDNPILVILGNPPYDAFAGTVTHEEGALVEPYKEGLRETWNIKKYNLDDLYVRFFRIAERKIGSTGRGIVSLITNYSFSEEMSYVVMRQKLLESFDQIWIENLHGNRKKSERAPDGNNSQTVFAMRGLSSGIQQGVVITTAIRTEGANTPAMVRYRDDIDNARAADRRAALLTSLEDPNANDHYEVAEPDDWNWLSFRPRRTTGNYQHWSSLTDLTTLEPLQGLMEKRGGALIDMDEGPLQTRMHRYFDDGVTWETLSEEGHPLTRDYARHDARRMRGRAVADSNFSNESILPFQFRAFDSRFCYYEPLGSVWNEARPKLADQNGVPGQRYVVTRRKNVMDNEGYPVWFTTLLGNDDAQRGHAHYFPFTFRDSGDHDLFDADEMPNVSAAALEHLRKLDFNESNQLAADTLLYHYLAISFAQDYLNEHGDGIDTQWPKVPLPNDLKVLENSAELGRHIASLLDHSQAPNTDLTTELVRVLAPFGRVDGRDLSITAGWGSLDKLGRCNPKAGSVGQAEWTEQQIAARDEAVALLGLEKGDCDTALGSPLDIRLNASTQWTGVGQSVWDIHIGGYPVLKKWLSYREEAVLGRAISRHEARHFSAARFTAPFAHPAFAKGQGCGATQL